MESKSFSLVDNFFCCFKFQIVYLVTELFSFLFFCGMLTVDFVIFSAFIIQGHIHIKKEWGHFTALLVLPSRIYSNPFLKHT